MLWSLSEAQKRSSDETQQVTVMWTLLALAREGVVDHDVDQALKMIVIKYRSRRSGGLPDCFLLNS